MRSRKFIAAAVFAVFSVGSPAFAEDAGKSQRDFLTKDGKLTAQFTLADTQGGFAGFTGNRYSITPDGSWTVTRVFNQRKFKPHASGKLSAKELRKLAAALKANRVDTLPAKSGSRAQANPLVITVTYGKHQSVCALPPGLTDPGKLPKGAKGDVGRRVLALRKAVKDPIPDKKKSSR
jgi:hypothetical protein